MLSDVPVGFLLSGGVDSTALLSYAVNETQKDLFSFTVGFSGQDFADERKYARIAAKKFGTKHYDMTINSEDFLKFLPEYVWHMEEPVCEPPAIALYYISRLASEHVKVLISGEGGDEAFAGYSNYANYSFAMKIGKLLGPLRGISTNIMRGILSKYANGKYKKYYYAMKDELRDYYYSRTSGPFSYFNENYKSFYTAHMGEVHENNLQLYMRNLHGNSVELGFLNEMLYVDSKTWLPDDLLIKADKMTMANSVELRVPFLDHDIMEFAANIHPRYKVNGFKKKYILKELFRGLVPDEILFRKKTGFPVPYEKWLRNDLHDYVKDIILDDKTIKRGYFNKISLENIFKNNKLYGIYSKEIFSLLVFEFWNRIFLDKGGINLDNRMCIPII
jgi:asparagine synthase (glutamine-hydrolysing)